MMFAVHYILREKEVRETDISVAGKCSISTRETLFHINHLRKAQPDL